MQYWLMKSEPEAFSIDDLKAVKAEFWDGVRNYQARNFMRDGMQKGDLAFFYHSNCKVPGIVGIMEVCKKASTDPTQFDKKSKYYDPKSSKDAPRWEAVTVKFKEKFSDTISLTELKANPRLKDFKLLQKGNRLSIMPVTAKEWKTILEMKDIEEKV